MKAKSQIRFIQQENSHLAEVLERFNTDIARYSNISPYSSKAIHNSSKETSKRYIKVKKELETLVNERKSIGRDMDLGHGNKSAAQLWRIRNELEQKLKQLTEENDVLKHEQIETSKNYGDEFEQLKKAMKSLEKERAEQINLVKLVKESEFFEKCLKDNELFERVVEDRKKNEVLKLQKHLKILERNIMTNRNKFAQEVKELQEYEESLGREKVFLQVRALKISQKQRLMDISQRSITPKESRSKNYSKVGYLFKPSINELYN